MRRTISVVTNMSMIANLLFLIVLASAASFPSPTSSPRSGRCRGGAINYLVSVSSLQSCVEACDNDDRCCHYSHHKSGEASHPVQDLCLLFSANECNIEDLVLHGSRSSWVTGDRTTATSRCPYFGIHMVHLRPDEILNMAGTGEVVVWNIQQRSK